MTVMVMAIAVLPAMYLIFLGINEAVQAYETTAEWFRAGRANELGVAISQLPVVGRFSQDMFGRLILANSGQLESSVLEGGKSSAHFCWHKAPTLPKMPFYL